MNFIQILQIILLLLQLSQSIVIDPICQSCLQIKQDLVQKIYRQDLKANLTLFTLPGFSQASIIVDFRHLKQFPKVNNEIIFHLFFQVINVSTKQNTITQINDTIIGTNQYQIAATEQLNLVISMLVIDQQKQFQYLLRDSISVKLDYSNNRITSEDSSYVFVVQSQDNINLPLNKPDLANINNYFLENQRNQSSIGSSSSNTQSTTYWSTDTQFAVPYFPYFSNCQGQGNMMQIMQMLQNESDCNLIPINETVWIREFNFGSSASADRCTIKRNCIIEGNVQKSQYPNWQTLPAQINLFQMTQKKIYWENYKYNMDFQPQDLVGCKIYSSMGSNESDKYPLKVKLTMGYYQVSEVQKTIISCRVQYGLYVTSTANFSYQLQISSYPLNHTYILLNFGFKWYVYMIVFVIIGLVGNIQNLILWIYHYFIASEKKQIQISIYLQIIKQIIKGTMIALLLEMLIIFIVCVIMNGKIFTTTFYEVTDSGSITPRVLFDYILQYQISNYDSAEMQNLRSGRMGIAFIVIGVMIILINSHFFVGKQKSKAQYSDFQIIGRVFTPLQWNRGKFLFGTFFYIALQYFFIYFAYSTLYSQNIWTFIVLMKVFQAIMEQINNSIYEDILPGLPLKIITDITSFLNTISAADLYDFLFGSLIDVAVTMIEKIYIFQIQDIIVQKIEEKSEEINKFYLNLMNEDDADDEKLQNYGEDGYLQNQNQDGNQHVFIYRQTQQVQFFQEQIKQVYSFTRLQDEQKVIQLTKQVGDEILERRKYFQSLQKDYKRQKQMLFKGTKAIQQEDKRQKFSKQPLGNSQGQQNQNQQKDEQSLHRQSQIFELLVDHVAMIYSFLMNPFVVFIFWLTYDQSDILNRYGISYNTVVLYILSSLVIGIFSVINIIMIFHILQNYMGYCFEEQISDVLKRFEQRRRFWKADEQQLNSKLKPEMQGADHYCLSSQFFFILTVYVGGMVYVILGLAVIFKTNYNAVDDVATIPIVLFWTLFLYVFIWLVKKFAKILNVWDYKKFQEQQNEFSSEQKNGTVKKMYGVVDFQDNTDFKTENLMIADDYYLQILELSSLSDNSKANINKKRNIKSKSASLKQIEGKIQNKKNILVLQPQNLQLKNLSERQEVLLAQKRLQTICKKLQPLFLKQAFKLQYSQKYKQFIKQNIEKILPLVDSLPELQQFKNMQQILSLTSHAHNLNKINTKQQTGNAKKQFLTSSNKNMDPIITQIIVQWLRATERSRNRRIYNGLQEESKYKKCSFCFQTWGLYYGHNGTCLQCSIKMAYEQESRLQKQKNQQSTQNENKNSSSHSRSLSLSKKEKNKLKSNNLNVIKQDIEEQQNERIEGDSQEDNSEDEIIKGSSVKFHQD